MLGGSATTLSCEGREWILGSLLSAATANGHCGNQQAMDLVGMNLILLLSPAHRHILQGVDCATKQSILKGFKEYLSSMKQLRVYTVDGVTFS